MRPTHLRLGFEDQGFLPPAPTPPHEVALFLVQIAMLGVGDLAGGTLDQRDETFAGKPAYLGAPSLGLRIELQPICESCGRRVEKTEQAARRTVVDEG